MSKEDDLAYYAIRAAEERQRAAAASDPAVTAVHLDMAQRYDKMVGSTEIASVRYAKG